MRRINTRTTQLEDVWNVEVTRYAILSHRWEEEIIYGEFHTADGRRKKGFIKIRHLVAQATKDGFDYVWCDICCIDKTSSAELSKVINSMFTWYQRATVCYVYLLDVVIDGLRGVVPESFTSSVWFACGWTLQELIASKDAVFFDSNWDYIGTKLSLSSIISRVTGIDDAILAGGSVFERSIAQRMSVLRSVESCGLCTKVASHRVLWKHHEIVIFYWPKITV